MHDCEVWLPEEDPAERPAFWHGVDPCADVARELGWWTTIVGIDELVEDYTRVLCAIALEQITWNRRDQKYVIGDVDEERLDQAIAQSR